MAHQRRDIMPCAPMKYPKDKKKKPGKNPHQKKRKPPKKGRK